jgi:hypothetical protein
MQAYNSTGIKEGVSLEISMNYLIFNFPEIIDGSVFFWLIQEERTEQCCEWNNSGFHLCSAKCGPHSISGNCISLEVEWPAFSGPYCMANEKGLLQNADC